MARRKNVKRIDPRYFLHETVNRNDDSSTLEEAADPDLWPSGVPAAPQQPPAPSAPEVPEGYPLDDLVAYYKKAWEGEDLMWSGDVNRLKLNVLSTVAERKFIKPGEPNPFYVGPKREIYNPITKYVVAKVMEDKE
jgi:hypothetical protein